MWRKEPASKAGSSRAIRWAAAVTVAGIVAVAMAATAWADPFTDFESGTLEDWSEVPTFNGDLYAGTPGHPGAAMHCGDTMAGGGGLYASAPPAYTGNLSAYPGIYWDEYLYPYFPSSPTFPLLVHVAGADTTIFMEADRVVQGVGVWQPRYVAFDPVEWERTRGNASFEEVLSNVTALWMSMDCNACCYHEAAIDNIGLGSPPVLGACCYPNGSCLYIVESQCATGDWREGANCTPNPCPPPPPEPGACCFPDGACQYIVQSECATGDWREGETCDPNPCPQPIDPLLCQIDPWDLLGKARFCPGTQSGVDVVTFTILRADGSPASEVPVTIQTSLNLCREEPESFSGLTDEAGRVTLDPHAGGGDLGTVEVVAGGITIRSYAGAAGTDLAGLCALVPADGQVDELDQRYFLAAMGTPDYRADLTGDGWVDVDDYQIFEMSLGAQDRNNVLCDWGIPETSVTPWDAAGKAFVSPGALGQADLVTVALYDSCGTPLSGQLIEIDLSGCPGLCIDTPVSGLSGITNIDGLVTLQPRVGGCANCYTLVKAQGVVIRSYDSIASTDWDGSEADGEVDDADAAFFQDAFGGGNDPCADYDGDGIVGANDLMVFTDAYMDHHANTTLCGPPDVTYTDIDAGLAWVGQGAAAWGDYDGDGDLDILLDGAGEFGEAATHLYRNSGGSFTEVNAGLPGSMAGGAAWGDYDADSDLDLVLTGSSAAGRISRIYRNDAGVLVDAAAGLPGVENSAVGWGDFDNDGDLDLALAGDSDVGRIARIYRNDAGNFTDVGAGLSGVSNGALAWGDYDRDGDLDLALAGATTSSARFTRIYRNNAGVFADAGAGLPGVDAGSLAWGDFDSDGDLDLAMMGATSATARIARVYRNDTGAFTDLAAGLPGVRRGSVAWGDCDNDGDFDLVLTGWDGTGDLTRVYRNDAGVFTDMLAGLLGLSEGCAAWGDYDNDGDLDLLCTGLTEGYPYACICQSAGAPPNSAPSPPAGLNATEVPGAMVFTWDAAADPETPPAGLSYNLRVGTTPGGCEVVSPMSGNDGRRRVVQIGNAQQSATWRVALPSGGVFYWSVQAVDAAFAGSQFASGVLALSGVESAEAAGAGRLRWCAPNPFRECTTIAYDPPAGALVQLLVLDSGGRLVRTLAEGVLLPGRQFATWDGRDESGHRVPSGVYYLRLRAGSTSDSRTVLHLR